MKRIIITCFFAIVFVNTFAQDGDLDLSFNAVGFAQSSDFYGSNVCNAIQNDGKILLAGKNNQNKLVVLRYNSNGSLDATFNGTGKGTYPGPMNGVIGTEKMLIQNDGKILVYGTVLNNSYDYDLTLIRINSDGTIDNTFGTNGFVTTDLSAGSEVPGKAVLQNDQKILVSAYSLESNTGAYYFTVIRYNSDGSFDTSFNTTGYNKIDLGCSNFYNYNMLAGSGIALQTDGKILFSGAYGNSEASRDMICIRLNTNGLLDVDFNYTGYVTVDFNGGEDFANDVKVDLNGKIIIAGKRYYYSSYAALARFNPDGTPDLSFGTNGKTAIAMDGSSYCSANNINILPDNKILIGGMAYISSNYNIATTRLNNNGTLDNTFGTNGSVSGIFLGATSLRGYFQNIQSDNKIVVSCGFNDEQFTVIRYLQRNYPEIYTTPTASAIIYG
ncbi:MAG: hypothetical protein JXR60_00450 [Bacteroidales bacterium]|nr:hypothetical protein [Bacteroidales bacterium]